MKTAALEEDVIASAKGWLALGAMDTAERSRALDLLGFASPARVLDVLRSGCSPSRDDLDVRLRRRRAPTTG